ncbi:MAG TPA: condensation domain-containing protein, partial [Isosphaeraceae bacterium]|nr:condensation domain-containing protein [Isosphaeraceae bacterium]
ILESLPLTPNGKVDRQALPNPAQARLPANVQFVPPRGPIEQALAEIWTDLLRVEPVGAHDNFFERGGHSLLAVQLLARIRQMFKVDTPLKDFLEDATVSRLGSIVEQVLGDGAVLHAPPLTRAQRDDSLPASFAQERLWFLDQLEPGHASYNIPAAVSILGWLDVSALAHALSDVVRRHEVLRTTLVSDKGIPRQVIATSLELPLELEDLSSLPEDERQKRAADHIREEAQRPFDLARGPLVRAFLLRMGEQEHIAVVIMHHAISDGWSIGILIREISVLYKSVLNGESSPLPEMPIQYVDYAVWQRNWLQGAILDAQLSYWTQQLAGLPDLELPTDRPRRLVASQRGGEWSTTLPKATLEAVRALGRHEGATLYMTLLAAFQVLLYRLSGQEDFAVGSPIAGRTHPELESLIGFFVNTLVMRADLSGDPGFRQLLHRVRQTAIEAYTHQDLPFEKVVSIAHNERDMSRGPLFQVMFAFQNAPLPPLRSSDLSLAPLSLPSETSKFDLTLFAAEVPEGLRLTMEYSTDLFDAATIDRMLSRYGLLLEEIVSHPDQPIRALQMLTAEERRLLLEGWNSAGTDLVTGLDVAEDGDLDFLWDESSDPEAAIDE